MSEPSLPDGVERREIAGEERLATRGEPVYGEPTA
ncbi:fibrillarin-like rRNA/tRNA 2'-O-methyltransferase, partial [Halorubrum sp. SS5]